MPKSGTQREWVMHDVYVLWNQQRRFQKEMVVWTWPGYSPFEIKTPRGCVRRLPFWPASMAALLKRCCRCCLYWHLFLTLACTNRPRSWCQPSSKRSSWKRLSRSRRSARDGCKAVFPFAAVATSARTPRQNWWQSLTPICRWDVAGSCTPCSQWFLFRPWSPGLCCCLSPPKTKTQSLAFTPLWGNLCKDMQPSIPPSHHPPPSHPSIPPCPHPSIHLSFHPPILPSLPIRFAGTGQSNGTTRKVQRRRGSKRASWNRAWRESRPSNTGLGWGGPGLRRRRRRRRRSRRRVRSCRVRRGL